MKAFKVRLRALKYRTVDRPITRCSRVCECSSPCLYSTSPSHRLRVLVVFRWTIFRIFSASEKWGNETTAGRALPASCYYKASAPFIRNDLGSTHSVCSFSFLNKLLHGGWWARCSEKFASLSSVGEILLSRWRFCIRVLFSCLASFCMCLRMRVDQKVHCELLGSRCGVIGLFAVMRCHAA